MEQSHSTQTNIKDLELNALLEVTQAINNNLPEESLYKIYKFTLLADFNVKKLALFVLGDQWECKVNFGVSDNFCQNNLPTGFMDLKESMELKGSGSFTEFDLAIPVLHKERLLAVVFVGGLKKDGLGEVLSSGTTFLEALTNIILVAIENKKLAKRQLEQEAYKKEMEIAKQVQQFLFPKELPSEKPLEIAARYLPHKDVGGDYYDYIKLDEDKFIVCIADVSGKGVPAALMMSNFQASLHTLSTKTTNLKEIVEDLNRQINLSGNGEIFITFFIALYDTNLQTFEYINCGHNPPLLLGSDDKWQLLDQGTTVLGMFCPLPFNTLGKIEALDGFTLFCYTDGLSEATNDSEEEYGPERIESDLLRISTDSPTEINEKILSTVDQFRGDNAYRDDVTLLTCRVGV
ncbi:MAG: PP2C family protein-serine/threonine phosphatase [Cyclobacteriaceae bacterium]